MVPLFPLHRRQVVVGGVQPALVVPGDPAEDRGARLGAGAVVVSVDELDLEGGEERLSDGVIQAGAGAAHGAPQPEPVADLDAGGRGVFSRFKGWSQHGLVGSTVVAR